MRHLVQVDGRIFETEISGTGDKTVVILPGMGCPIDDWMGIIDALSDECRVLVFHRAGCGASDPNPRGSSVLHTVEDLRSLLDGLSIRPPVILVGHSYGGLIVQRYAREYPDLVSGVVLIDSTSVDLERLDSLRLPTLDEQQSDAEWLDQCKQFASMTSTEIFEENSSLLSPHQLQLSEEAIERIIQFYTNPRLYKTMAQEVEVWNQCAKDTKESERFPDVPLKIIARDPEYCIELLVADGIPLIEAELFENTWHDLIVEQGTLSARAELITATNATHSVYEDRADIILQVIKELVKPNN